MERWPPARDAFLSGSGDPLRIMLVAPWFDYGMVRRGLSYEQTHFATTLQGLGYDVSCFDFLQLAHKHGQRDMNRMLRDVALRVRPDLAFFVLFKDEIEPASLEWMNELGVTTFNWFCDDQWRYEDFSSRWAPRFNWVSTTSSEAHGKYSRDDHTNVLKTQWGFAPTLFRFATDEHRKDIDVLFVGQPHSDRRQVIGRMEKQGISVQAFGHGWPRGKVTFSEVLSLFRRSKVVLGLSNDSSGRTRQVKGRDFEVPASGAFYLTSENPELNSYFTPGLEVATYSSIEQLTDQTRYYLSNNSERESIARSGWERSHNEHSYVHRFREIFSAMGFIPQRTHVNR